MLQCLLQQLSGKRLAGLDIGSKILRQGGDVTGKGRRFEAKGIGFGIRKVFEGSRLTLPLGIPVYRIAFGIVLRFGQQGGVFRPQFLQ
jgi:hypothetical protein